MTIRRRTIKAALLLAALALGLSLSSTAAATRIKDVARVDGVRANQLIGYGLVVGLDRTGDTQRATMTLQSLTAMLSRMGVRIDPNDIILRNVAAVMVTAQLPALAETGTPVDVVVSAIGDARSLSGGTLLLTPLNGLDGRTYAMAQGPVQIGGFGARGRSGSRIQKNHLNVGRVPSGALVERAVPVQLAADGALKIHLDKPDFTTARRLADAINGAAASLGGEADMARVASGATVEVKIPADRAEKLPRFIADLEVLEVQPDAIARVVINGRTGTVVMGEQVRIAPVAVAHGALIVEVSETPAVSQPAPLAGGTTTPVPASAVAAQEPAEALKVVAPGATLAAVVGALNALGATPRDLIEILQAIHAAGALQAELEVL